MIEEALLAPMNICLGKSADERGPLGALWSDQDTVGWTERGKLPCLGVLDLILLADQGGQVVRIGQFARKNTFTLQNSLGINDAANYRQPGFLLVEIFIQPLAKPKIVIAVKFRGTIQNDGSLFRTAEPGGEDLIRINLNQEITPGVAFE